MHKRMVGIGICIAVFAINSVGQTTVSTIATVNNATQTPVEGVGHDYLHDLSETVNPQNGQVSIRIAGPAPHERGLNFPLYAFMYDTSGSFPMGGQLSFGSCSTQGSSVPMCRERVDAPVWAYASNISNSKSGMLAGQDNLLRVPDTNLSLTLDYTAGPVTCSFSGPYTYVDPQGGLHPMNYITNVIGSGCGSTFGIVGGTGVSGTPDPHFKIWPGSGISDMHGDIFFGDGLQSAEDTNGNFRNGTGRPWSITSVTQPDGFIGPNTETLPGIADPSTNQDVPYTYQYATFTKSTNPGLSVALLKSESTQSCYVDLSVSSSSTFYAVNKLVLPNGQYYKFGYDSRWGLVDSIAYPTGATVSYTWEVNSLSEPFNVISPSYDSVIASTEAGEGQQACYFQQDLPAVESRVVSYDGVTPAVEQDFYYSTTWGGAYGSWTSKQTKVVTTDLIRSGKPKTITFYNYLPMYMTSLPWSSGFGISPVEDTIVYQDGAGNTLHTVKKVWNDINLLTAECDILDTGEVSGKFYQYQYIANYGSSDLPTDVAEYDSTQGVTSSCVQPASTTPPARETKTQYASLPSSKLWPVGNLSKGAIPQINDRPSIVQVYDHGTRIAETDISYDETSVQTVTPTAVGHDETNYGSGQTTARGNATTITRKCFPSCTDAITKVKYDETGQIVSVVDPDGNAPGATAANHTTTLSYGDSYSAGGTPPGNTNTYITGISRPATNGVTHTSSYQYHYMFGELTSATDVENEQTSTYQYNDIWGRPRLAAYPDGGKTKIDYDDTALTITTSKLLTSNVWASSVDTRDGVGHVISTEQSDPGGNDIVDMEYDGEGLLCMKSNPYRGAQSTPKSCTDPNVFYTSYTYDALGRKTKQLDPDGVSAQNWSYRGNTVTFTDEDLNRWQRTSDAFGNLTQVLEPNGANAAPSMETDYRYDALSNLLSTTQLGGATATGITRSRSFNYDSLSRLLTAANPETGTICYGQWSGSNCTGGYDPNGNLLYKTDARGVVTGYSYDALNRLYAKTYTNASAGTMASCYQYDNPASGANGIGRLAAEWTQVGGCSSPPPSTPPAINQSLRTYGAYDAMGRAITEFQCAAGYCTTASAPSNPAANCTALSSASGLQYCYDLAGNLLAYTNGVTVGVVPAYQQQALLFSQTFDAAGRLSGVYSSWTNDSTHPSTLFSGTSYSPANALTNWVLGAHLAVTRSYDPARLWVTGQSAQKQ